MQSQGGDLLQPLSVSRAQRGRAISKSSSCVGASCSPISARGTMTQRLARSSPSPRLRFPLLNSATPDIAKSAISIPTAMITTPETTAGKSFRTQLIRDATAVGAQPPAGARCTDRAEDRRGRHVVMTARGRAKQAKRHWHTRPRPVRGAQRCGTESHTERLGEVRGSDLVPWHIGRSVRRIKKPWRSHLPRVTGQKLAARICGHQGCR
jgi:hypothetical protein